MSTVFASETLEKQHELSALYGRHAKSGDLLIDFPQDTAADLSRELFNAQPVYVTREIVDALVHALPSLPTDLPIHPEDIPLPSGFAWFGGKYDWVIPEGSPTGLDLHVNGFSWRLIRPYKGPAGSLSDSGWRSLPYFTEVDAINARKGVAQPVNFPGGVQMTLWGHWQSLQSDLTEWLITDVWGWGEPINVDGFLDAATGTILANLGKDDGEMIDVIVDPASGGRRVESVSREDITRRLHGGANSVRQMAYSLWSFMNQKIASRELWGVDRATRRRFEGYVEWEEKPLPQVEIVKLRARESSPKRTDGNGETRTIEERFIVRGHWHRYIYGKKDGSEERRVIPRWVEAYIKGPEDMPLKSPTKFFEVIR